MWGCVGWRSFRGTHQGPCDPRVPQHLRHLYGPLQWGCQEAQAVPGSPLGGVLAPTAVLEHFGPHQPPWLLVLQCSCPITLLEDPLGLCCVWLLARMVSGSAPEPVVLHPFPSWPPQLCTGRRKRDRGFFFRLALSSQPLFSEKKTTPCLAVRKTTALCGNAAPLYPWTSGAGRKVPSISMCGNSPFAPLCYTATQESSHSGFLLALQCWLMSLFGSHGGRLTGICRDLACAMSLVHPWALAQPPTSAMPSSVCCLQGWSVSCSTRST